MENNEDVKTTEQKVEQETTQKTYTIDDVNNSYKAGVKKARTELEQSEDYKKYQNWKKTNQSDSEKMAELQTNYDNLLKENKLLKATNEVAKSDVKPEFIKFVTSEVMGLVNDTTNFETALKNYKKECPQYFGETQVKKVQSSPFLGNGGNQPQTTNSIMNDILRGSKNNN